MDLPPFQDFLETMRENKASTEYDIGRFSDKRIKEPNDAFSKEQYATIGSACIAIAMAILAQYHQWLEDQLNENEFEGKE